MNSHERLNKRLKGEDVNWPSKIKKWLPCICGADVDPYSINSEEWKFTGLLPICMNGHFQYKHTQQPIHRNRLVAEGIIK